MNKRDVVRFDLDAVYFGDDWGQQRGLQMGPKLWRRFLRPVLERMYGAVRDAGKLVMIHSCGDVDELFDDLVGSQRRQPLNQRQPRAACGT